MNHVDAIIWLPLLIGIILFAVPNRWRPLKAIISVLVSGIVLTYALQIYFLDRLADGGSIVIPFLDSISNTEFFSSAIRIDSLNKLIVTFISVFSFLVIIYASTYAKREKGFGHYYSFILLTLGASNGAAFSYNLLLFLVFWSFLAITLYKLLPSNDEKSSAAAMKSLIIIGASDVLMLFGIVIIWVNNGSLSMIGQHIETNTAINIIAFLALIIGSFTKAGAFPFHSWIPDYTERAPATSSAYLPASLDKLLGIYFMVRICYELFELNSWLVLVLLIIGVATIIIGVMMALIQHNFKRLLGYHAVSQVGYMIAGLGLGSTLGLVGGLFHMINNSLYKNGLFLAAGNVEEQTGKDDLDEVGGLSRKMPFTFFAALIFALSISGVPPFNGFASKWIIYQAIVDFGKEPGVANNLWILWLALAVIGSALTLASFIKFISGLFLGRAKTEFEKVREPNPAMIAPLLVMAILCIGFGVLATEYVVPFLFEPIVGEVVFTGLWSSGTISILVVSSLLLGFIIYLIGNIKNFRTEDSFVGGETFRESTGFSVTEFYQTIRQARPWSFLYKKAEKGYFDLYSLSKNGVLKVTHVLSHAHSGILQTYALWLILGLILMMMILIVF